MLTNWTGGTNLPLGVLTNKATIVFAMASNLTLTANFVDVQKPSVAVTNLVANRRLTAGAFTVKGTATDNWQVVGVWCQINTNGWFLATTTNAYRSWAATNMSLTAGTNLIKAFAEDLGGNYSSTNTVAVVATNVLVLNPAITQQATAGNPVMVLSGAGRRAGGWQFNLQITGGASGLIQSSTNLMDWETITNFIGTNTTINFCDPQTNSFAQKFYRAVAP